ncbi:MAG: hypothetical protein V1861_05110, partial [Candidatus Micrarchaeota archaeon]
MRKALLVILLLISEVHPGISNLGLSGSLDSSGTASLTIATDFFSSSGKTACLNISGSLDEIQVKDRSGLVIGHTERHENNSTLICAPVPVNYLEYSATSSSWTTKSGSLWDFDLSVGSTENISAFNASMVLPPGSTLKGTNGAVSSGNGSLIISYSARQIDTAHRARMRASYELAANTEQAAPPDYMLIAGLGILALAAILFIAIQIKKAKAAQSPPLSQPPSPVTQTPASVHPVAPSALESNAIFRTLDETDREIIREISRQGGKT